MYYYKCKISSCLYLEIVYLTEKQVEQRGKEEKNI